MNPRTALITGNTCQDGRDLIEHLPDYAYRVVGVTRRTSSQAGGRDLGWRPTVGFAELVRIMIEADMAFVGGVWERMRPDGQLTASGRQP